MLQITKKKFQDKELPHELFLTTRQKNVVRNDFTNKCLSMYKLSIVQNNSVRWISW